MTGVGTVASRGHEGIALRGGVKVEDMDMDVLGARDMTQYGYIHKSNLTVNRDQD